MKKILSIFLTLMMLTTSGIVPVKAEDVTEPDVTENNEIQETESTESSESEDESLLIFEAQVEPDGENEAQEAPEINLGEVTTDIKYSDDFSNATITLTYDGDGEFKVTNEDDYLEIEDLGFSKNEVEEGYSYTSTSNNTYFLFYEVVNEDEKLLEGYEKFVVDEIVKVEEKPTKTLNLRSAVKNLLGAGNTTSSALNVVYESTGTFTWNVPSSVNLNNNTSFNVSMDTPVSQDYIISISIDSTNNYKLVGSYSELAYSLSDKNGTTLSDNDVVLKYHPTSLSQTVLSNTLTVSMPSTTTEFADTLSDEIIFNAGLEENVPDNYVGYYADVDGDGTADGMIFFDYASGAEYSDSSFFDKTFDTISAKTSGLATYKLVGHNMVQKVGAGDDRFYVIALSNVPADVTHNSNYYDWYNAAYSIEINNYATINSTAFGTGKTNTATMKAAWNASTYGTQNSCSSHSDMWSIDMGDWFVPSKDEWSVLGSELKKVAGSSSYSSITTDAGAAISFSDYYWSSSLDDSFLAWDAGFPDSYLDGDCLNYNFCVRLATTF